MSKKRPSVFDNSTLIGARCSVINFHQRPDGKFWGEFDTVHEEQPADPIARREYLDFAATVLEREAKKIRDELKETLN